MLLNKCLKALPIPDLMPTPLLIVGDGSTVASFLFALEPQVERIATDVEHLAHISFALTANDAQQALCGAYHYCKGRTLTFLVGLYLSTIRPNAD